MGIKMRHAPVYFTIAQARFNSILALDSYAPQIQERLRKEGFPDAKKGFLATINLNLAAPTEASAPQVPVAQTTRYMFCNMEQTSGCILDQGALSFQTTDYDVFEKFCSRQKHSAIICAALCLVLRKSSRALSCTPSRRLLSRRTASTFFRA